MRSRAKRIGKLLRDNLVKNLEEKYGKDDSKWPGAHSKSEAKRVAIMKGEDMHEAVKKFEEQTKV